ncbi:MAG: L,D-transpeptidase, partial [Rhodoferax sp.]|nr:L,D-transpeptidase [Rhodoferax sp.]
RVLLGVTMGDLATAGVGERTRNGTLRRSDLTTPAGRFESAPGRNLDGEPVVWIDYESALAIHRLRPGASRTSRALQLASVKVGDKRASAGCVVVPEAFYDRVIGPVLGRGRGIVYVMPEHSSWRDMWRGLSALSP